MKSKVFIRKKRIIEIYFVLYLAALILLIPGKEQNDKTKNENNNNIFQIPFSLKAEKTSLNAYYKIDSLGIKTIIKDTVNNIFYTGNVSDVNYSITIKDISSNQNYKIIEPNNNYNIFNYEKNNKDNSLIFRWKPDLKERKSKSYNITITAKAKSLDSNSYGKIVEDKIQFAVNLNIDLEDFKNIEKLDLDNSNIKTNIELVPNERVILLPRDEVINVISSSQWENEINIIGLSPKKDLRKQPEIEIIRVPNDKIGGSAYISGVKENSLIIKGEAPYFGTMSVKVKLIRHSDGFMASKSFQVKTILMEEPQVPEVIYPGISYKLEPKIPISSSKSSYTELKDKDGIVYAKSTGNNSIYFTPNFADTGKILFLERYIDNNLIGQRYRIRINNFPNPEIYRISEIGNKKIRVYTNAYGLYNKNPNYIKSIEIIEGNAKVREIIGAQSNPDTQNYIYKQVFEIIPSDNSKQFYFKIRAVAENGQKSEIKTYYYD